VCDAYPLPVLLVAFMLGAKFIDDYHISNAAYAKIGKIDVVQLNRLEIAMLNVLNYGLTVPLCEYNKLYIAGVRYKPQIKAHTTCLGKRSYASLITNCMKKRLM
jgi:hypothetical protein